MPQTSSFTIANSNGSTFRSRVNEVVAALQSCSSGATAPASPVAGMFWFDTTNLILKIRNNANTTWIDLLRETMPANSLRGNPTGSAALEQDISMAQLSALFDSFGGRTPLWRAAVATTSGANVTLESSFPSYARRITVILDGISTTSGTATSMQIGDSGGFATTGYISGGGFIAAAGASNNTTLTTGFNLPNGAAADAWYGRLVLEKPVAAENTWLMSGSYRRDNDGATAVVNGRVTLTGALTQMRLTLASGTFDAGRAIVGIE